MPDDWLSTLLDESVRMGAAVAVILTGFIIGILFFVNLRWPMFISYRVHRERVDAESKRADKAEQDADDDHDDQNSRFAEQMRQVSDAHKAEMERLLKFAESLQREVESWRQAYHVEAAGNDAEESARWDRIDAALGVLQRFVTEVQRHAPRALDAGHDGTGGSNVG